MNKTSKWLIFGCLAASFMLWACSGASRQPPSIEQPASRPQIKGPEKIVLLDKSITLQDEHEPYQTLVTLDFDLPYRPRRARLLLKYSGVPGATSEDYLMGRFRHKIELNQRYLMDLNTFSQGQEQVVEHTKWISVSMLKRNNVLDFIAGDDGSRQGQPDCDEFDLHSVVMEFDW